MTQATSPAAVSKERATELMNRFVAAWEQGDLAALDEIFAPDFLHHGPPFPDMGRDGLREFIRSFRTGFTGIHVQLHEHLLDGSVSVHRWSVEAVLSGTTELLPGVEPTGQRTTAQGAHVLHWSGGQVTEAWHFGDWLGWLARAGAMPAPPGIAG